MGAGTAWHGTDVRICINRSFFFSAGFAAFIQSLRGSKKEGEALFLLISLFFVFVWPVYLARSLQGALRSRKEAGKWLDGINFPLLGWEGGWLANGVHRFIPLNQSALKGVSSFSSSLGFSFPCLSATKHPNSKSDGNYHLEIHNQCPAGIGNCELEQLDQGKEMGSFCLVFFFYLVQHRYGKGEGGIFRNDRVMGYIAGDNGGVGKGIRCLHNREKNLISISITRKRK